MVKRIPFLLTTLAALSLLASCGGGDDSPAGPDASGAAAGETLRTAQAAPTVPQRIVAATKTANSETNACAPIRPFYWEVGNRSTALASGSTAAADGSVPYVASTQMNLASASKWIYSTYYVQRQNGVLGDTDIKHLQLRSGYTGFSVCYPYQTVRSCLAYADNGVYNAGHDGLFFYDGGHMQKHAAVNGLGPMDRLALSAEVVARMGGNLQLQYGVPALAGGGYGSARGYTEMLRRIMRSELAMGPLLGTRPVCTNPQVCPAEAVRSPNPDNENWHYSIGHWLEDDPVVGDGSFSSPGSKGFYPWIDSRKQIYGVIAREAEFGYFPSVACGRLIRKAWQTATPQ